MGAQTSQTAFLPIPVIRDAKIKSFASKRPDERRSEALRHPLNAIVAAAVVIRSIVVYSHAMEITHAHLQETVKEQIDSYVVPEHHSDAVGSAMPRSWFSDRLDEMRAAVVSPVPVRMHDVDDKTGDLVTLNVLIVVDDKQGTLVAYDPESCDFVLANYALEQGHTRPLEAASTGVRGSAVDCYLAA